ncbi:3-hydroxybenzoate 6-hydroxylase 1 [Cytospora mali]|uniref:3-hydroxybenzoate 6-hydroxylase 1 n=1 Tax=Cytospora mali TaxID=578113 RepID=A0A194UPY4_CYTMA|nr:3-hydroxybenzoate 6-hydroxylase 1 [Valsa mali var. pyri (nom. inval.)]
MDPTPTPSRLRVLVAGGGIGGLTAAIALRQQGHEVEVFEKSKLHRDFGAAVYVAPNCTAALSHIDINPGDVGGVPYRGFNFLDANCKVDSQWTFTEEERAKWPAAWWLVSRIDLHNALKQKAAAPDGPGAPVKIHTGLGADSVDSETGSISLTNGTTVTGDLIVCADGIHSKTRRSIMGRDVPLFSSGQACYRWLVPTSVLAEDPVTKTFVDKPGHFVQWAGSNRRVAFYPCASGTVINCVAILPREEVGDIKRGLTGYDQSANKKELLSHFETFAPPVLRMLDKAPGNNVKLWDLLDMELQPSLIKGKALLIGDAGHPFLPYLGQGAAQAIEDACALGAVLPLGTPADEIPQRLKLWQDCRKDRAYKIVEDTRTRGRDVEKTYGSPEAMMRFNTVMQYCINHDAWKHAEEQMKTWLEQKV